MIQRLKDMFVLRNLHSAAITLGKEGPAALEALTLERRGDELLVLNRQRELKSVAHLAKHFKAGPMVLFLKGRGILTKTISVATTIDQGVINQILPGADGSAFYFQLSNGDQGSVVSAIRRNMVDDIVAELTAEGYQVILVRLGSEADDPAYQTALKCLRKEEQPEILDAKIQDNRLEAQAKAKVKGIALSAAAIVFVLLLFNFFAFSHYEEKSARLSASKTRSGMEIRKYRDIESAIAEKTTFIQSAGWMGGYPASWLTSQLLSTKPQAVQLTRLQINPARSERPGAKVGAPAQTQKIEISGYCDNAATLNSWLHDIRSQAWVGGCGIRSYELNKFIIQVNISNYEG